MVHIERSELHSYNYVKIDRWGTPVYTNDILQAHKFSTEKDAVDFLVQFNLPSTFHVHYIVVDSVRSQKIDYVRESNKDKFMPKFTPEKIGTFILNSMKYPVSELFGSIDTPDAKQKKAEKRIAQICEELYQLECTTLSDVRVAYREMQVAVNLSDEKFRVKQVRLVKMSGTLAYYIDKASAALEAMHKKDQLLQQYWKPLSVKSKDMKDELKSHLIQYYPNVEKTILLSEFDNAYKEAKENDK